MAYNHAKEELRFANHWEKLRKEYVLAGMNEDAIQAMYEFDRSVFNSNRTYKEHTVRLVTEDDAEDEDELAYAQELLKKHFSSFSIFDDYSDGSVLGWIEDIESSKLASVLKTLSTADLLLLTRYAIFELPQPTLAQIYGTTQQAISKKICRIKKTLKSGL